MGGAVTHKVLPYVVGEIDHPREDIDRNLRELLLKQIHLYFSLRIAKFHHDEPVHKRDVLSHDTLVKSGFVARAVGVGCDYETEHGIRHDEFTTVLSDAKRRTI